MIRSSRIPLVLDQICTDGILSSLLITKDGELLGCSTKHRQTAKEASAAVPTATAAVTAAVTTAETTITQLEECSHENSRNHKNDILTMNPSHVGALIAEVIQDYKQLGCELTLLDPILNNTSPIDNIASTSATSTSASVNAGTTTAMKAAGSLLRTSNSRSATGNANGNGNATAEGNATNTNVKSHEQQHQQKGTTKPILKMTEDMKESSNTLHKDRGRLNCLVLEMDMGLIGIASATSTTYVVAIADLSTQHGLLKDKLTVLATLLQENLEMVPGTVHT